MQVVIVDCAATPAGPSPSALALLEMLLKHNVETLLATIDQVPPVTTYTHVILAGDSPAETAALPSWLIESTAPVLGVGYGAILIAQHFGATVTECSPFSRLCDVTEMIGGTQARTRRLVEGCHTIISLDRKLWKLAVDKDNQVLSFTDYRRWTGHLHRPELSQDFSVLSRFLWPATVLAGRL